MENQKEYVFKPIGLLYTPYKSKEGVPIQGSFDSESKGRAEIFGEYEPGLRDIEGFSHLILIYVFHQSEDSGLGDRVGHAEHHRTGLILAPHRRARLLQQPRARGAIRTHAGQHHSLHGMRQRTRCRLKQQIDTRLVQLLAARRHAHPQSPAPYFHARLHAAG